jgi:cation transporter-like permease
MTLLQIAQALFAGVFLYAALVLVGFGVVAARAALDGDPDALGPALILPAAGILSVVFALVICSVSVGGS